MEQFSIVVSYGQWWSMILNDGQWFSTMVNEYSMMSVMINYNSMFMFRWPKISCLDMNPELSLRCKSTDYFHGDPNHDQLLQLIFFSSLSFLTLILSLNISKNSLHLPLSELKTIFPCFFFLSLPILYSIHSCSITYREVSLFFYPTKFLHRFFTKNLPFFT